jgi:deoxyribodipyrimidine photo-lyase
MNLFIFHNDLRLQDNIGLSEALKDGKVIPVFIFTPTQIGKQNPYRSQNAINFMCEALINLDDELREHSSQLHVFYGNTHSVVEGLIKKYKITGVYSNMNYTPFAIERDAAVAGVCKKHKVEFIECEDFGLFPIGSITTGDGVYRKFTPYYNAASKHKVPEPISYKFSNLTKIKSGNRPLINKFKTGLARIKDRKGNLDFEGKRKYGLNLLHSAAKHTHYDRDRNILAIRSTEMSCYIKFGLVSIREVYHVFKKTNADLVKQLIWREYYMNLVWAYPYILQGKNRNLNERERKVNWRSLTPSNSRLFIAWCKGKTGCPIVDAAMTQLNTTGYMHNRGRLITGWYLVKILGFNWIYGERYFATQLRDYDPAQNNGGWQFVAGSQDSYYRGFNYMLQSAKYDPDAYYIKNWLPELNSIPAKHLHEWENYYTEYPKVKYPKPIITYDKKFGKY